MAAMMMSLTAQAKTQDVDGRVIDQNGEPLGFVSIALLSADSTYIQGATSDENGAFMIQTTDACCILRLSYIGYRTQYVNVKGSDVGTIQMEEDQPLLSEIIVKGQMPKTKLNAEDETGGQLDDNHHPGYYPLAIGNSQRDAGQGTWNDAERRRSGGAGQGYTYFLY